MKRASALVLAGLLLAPPIFALPAGDDWIEWDRATEHVVSAPRDTGAAYPRARQLSNGEILLAYHHGEALGDYGSCVTLRKSRDGGATWYQTQEIDGPEPRKYWGFSSPDFIELGHGRLMLVSAARPKSDPFSRDAFLSECARGGLRVRFSDDYGATWGPPSMIAARRGRVWEPSIVRLPSGELEIFYANESPNLEEPGSTQCIESIRSADGGQTWGTPLLVSEDAGCRNGMPAALTLSNGHVACVQEVVGSATSPWIADTVRGRTDAYHLAQDQYGFGAAPFLARAPDASTLLAFHSQCLQPLAFRHLNRAWMFSQIYVQRGDALGQDFGPASCPWPEGDEHSGAFFPSLMVMSDGSLVAMASFITVQPNHPAVTVVRWIKGRMIASAAVTRATNAEPARLSLRQAGVPPRAEPVSASPPLGAAEYKYGPPDQ